MRDDSRAIGEMKISSEKEVLEKKSAPVPLCTSQIPHDLTRA
jgi:hypothetical protein